MQRNDNRIAVDNAVTGPRRLVACASCSDVCLLTDAESSQPHHLSASCRPSDMQRQLATTTTSLTANVRSDFFHILFKNYLKIFFNIFFKILSAFL